MNEKRAEIDPDMRRLMETAEQEIRMINYIVTKDTRAKNKPVGGWDVGAVRKGFEFSSEKIQSGRVAIDDNKWIPYGDVAINNPPDDDPPPVDPPPADSAPKKVIVENDDGSVYVATEFVKVQ